MKNSRLKIFCDFDGTITLNDVWLNSIGKFVNDKEALAQICNELYGGKLTTKETLKRELELVENFSLQRFDELLEKEEIDPHFADFTEYCKECGHELRIVSSGLDYYISKILSRNKLEVDFYSCKMIWDETRTRPGCEFVYTDEYCNDCETCKRNILISNTNELEGEVSVYIGDGISDYCVSGFADIVFAKGRLASYCWKNNITYFDYSDFSDIRKKLEKLASGSLRHRREAMMRRRDVLSGG